MMMNIIKYMKCKVIITEGNYENYQNNEKFRYSFQNLREHDNEYSW